MGAKWRKRLERAKKKCFDAVSLRLVSLFMTAISCTALQGPSEKKSTMRARRLAMHKFPIKSQKRASLPCKRVLYAENSHFWIAKENERLVRSACRLKIRMHACTISTKRPRHIIK